MVDDATADAPRRSATPLPGAPAAVGDVLLGRWTVAELHRGGQAWVLVVDDAETADRRAIKIPISNALAGDAELVTLLELKRHPNVVTALDVVDLFGRRGLVLEYAPGTLAGLFRQCQVSSAAERIQWMMRRATVLQDICAGMAYLSENAEFAHLDLKPSNVLLTADGYAKIADFGLSRTVRGSDGSFSTAAGGTWAYAAPEAIRQDVCDSRADIFSFGIMLYEAFTGRLPFPFPLETAPAAQRAQLYEYYDPDAAARRRSIIDIGGAIQYTPPDHANSELDNIISGCLQLNMGERYSSFSHLARSIGSLLRVPQTPGAAEPVSEADQPRRELALSQALIRLGRLDQAIRRLNRLLAVMPPSPISAEVLRTAQDALIQAGRPDDAAALEE